MMRLAFAALLLVSQIASATTESPFPDLKKTAAVFGKHDTVGALFKSVQAQLDPATSNFLQQKLKGLEATHYSIRDVSETKLTLAIGTNLVPIEFPNLTHGRLKPMLINHRQVLAENAPMPDTARLFELITKALPEYQTSFASLLLPHAEATPKAGIAMGGWFTLFLRFLGGTCFESEITKKQTMCGLFGQSYSSTDSRQTNYTQIDEKFLIDQAHTVCDQDQLKQCADASNINELRAAITKLGQCYQNLMDSKQINLPVELRPCLGLSATTPAPAGGAPAEANK